MVIDNYVHIRAVNYFTMETTNRDFNTSYIKMTNKKYKIIKKDIKSVYRTINSVLCWLLFNLGMSANNSFINLSFLHILSIITTGVLCYHGLNTKWDFKCIFNEFDLTFHP